MDCVHCNSKELVLIDKYKHLLEEDKKYLNDMNIYRCNNCKLIDENFIYREDGWAVRTVIRKRK
tara:strand:- start:318 stop:509 length:192 start_codon:yes stop_codon:yes gene_type:complete